MLEELEWPISLRVRLAHLRKATEIYVGRHGGQRENNRGTTWVRGEFTGLKNTVICLGRVGYLSA
jgi:hypothetical protein